MRRALVTGGAGYVGAHACKALARAGYEITVFDNLKRGRRDFVRWGGLIEGDLCDADAIAEAVARVQPDAVLHFAALAYVAESVAEPSLYYGNNVGGTLCLLDAMRRAGVAKLVFSSSCATYGIPQLVPIPDDHPQNPISPYGATKLVVEQILRDYSVAYGLRSVSLRYFNAAGADPDAEIGEAHAPETHLVPLAIDAAITPSRTLEIFGADYDTPDRTAIRDYVHVTDLADGHLRALDYLENGGATTAFNLGTGVGVSVREVIGTVENVTSLAVRAREATRRPGDPPRLVADARRAGQILRWVPRRSDIAQIIETAVAWRQKDMAGLESRRPRGADSS